MTLATDDLFLRQMTALLRLVKLNHQLRSWCNGCACHEEQLLAGMVVSCSMKGRRLPELDNRLCKFYTDVYGLGSLIADDPEAVDARPALLHGIAKAKGFMMLKTSFTKPLPTSICYCRDRDRAKAAREEYNQLRAKASSELEFEQITHRVARKFSKPGTKLARLMDAWCDIGVLDAEL